MALIRLGGRMSAAGQIAHIFCFRHSFLRDRTEQVPTVIPSEVFDYPYKFRPVGDAEGELAYRPQNLNFQYERLRWEGISESSIQESLDHIAANIEHRFLPWAETLTLASARSEIEDRGELAWCERMWVEDYATELALNGS